MVQKPPSRKGRSQNEKEADPSLSSEKGAAKEPAMAIYSPDEGPPLMECVRRAIRAKHYSLRTEEAYCQWIRRYIHFHEMENPCDMGEREINAFLTHLAVGRKVAPSTQNQALAALLFLYRVVLGREPLRLENMVRAKKPKRLPVVLSRREVQAVLEGLEGQARIMGRILYGAGLRLTECLKLRVQDVDFERDEITVRSGKGGKDRVTPLPRSVKEELTRHLEGVRATHEQDLREGYGAVELPYALAEKYPSAPKQWGWQYVFPSVQLSQDPRSKETRRHHMNETYLQKAIRRSVRATDISKPVGAHTLRHSFATHLIEDGYDIRTVQELLGHTDVSTTMVYTHVLKRGGLGVRSPADALSPPIAGPERTSKPRPKPHPLHPSDRPHTKDP